MTCTHGDDWREPDGECEARGCTETLADRQAILLGREAALRAQREQHARLSVVARERDRKLAAAIRKVTL